MCPSPRVYLFISQKKVFTTHMILFVFGTNSFYLKSKVTPLNILYTQNKHKWLKNTHVSLKKKQAHKHRHLWDLSTKTTHNYVFMKNQTSIGPRALKTLMQTTFGVTV